jgi:hypothetical protein
MSVNVDDLRHLAMHGYFSQQTKDVINAAADEIETLSKSVRECTSAVAYSEKFCCEIKPRIRKKLLFGFHPDIDDLRLLWNEVFGEEIQPGKRCTKCNGEGKVPWYGHAMADPEPIMLRCTSCTGTGYEIKPTWMEQADAEAKSP